LTASIWPTTSDLLRQIGVFFIVFSIGIQIEKAQQNKKMEDQDMNLVKWNHQPVVFDIFDEMERKFFNPFRDGGYIPATNIMEKENSYQIELAAPGLQKGDFKISLENNILTVSSEKTSEKKEETENYTRKEFQYGSFSRSFTLPKTVESDKIKAAYENGILKVELPKKEETKVSKEIQIA
jgi:HSP20 family protein